MRLYYGGYGHHPSGKQYVYWGGNNLRTGQNVVAPVTNKWSGKTYNTMFTIMRKRKGYLNLALGLKALSGQTHLSFQADKTMTPKKPGRKTVQIDMI